MAVPRQRSNEVADALVAAQECDYETLEGMSLSVLLTACRRLGLQKVGRKKEDVINALMVSQCPTQSQRQVPQPIASYGVRRSYVPLEESLQALERGEEVDMSLEELNPFQISPTGRSNNPRIPSYYRFSVIRNGVGTYRVRLEEF